MEGEHTNFLIQIMGKQMRRLGDGIWDMGDALGGRSAGGSENAVEDDLYRQTEGNHGTLDGVKPTI